MRINKLLNAVKHIDQVFDGVKNKIWKKEYVEDIAKDRWQHCLKCEHLDRQGLNCAVPKTQPCCADCGCSLGFKLRALSSSCPKNKWKAVMSEEEEKKINKQNFDGNLKDSEDASNI